MRANAARRWLPQGFLPAFNRSSEWVDFSAIFAKFLPLKCGRRSIQVETNPDKLPQGQSFKYVRAKSTYAI
jgi:hypothetical protein